MAVDSWFTIELVVRKCRSKHSTNGLFMEHIYDAWRLFEEKGIKKDGRTANEEILLAVYGQVRYGTQCTSTKCGLVCELVNKRTNDGRVNITAYCTYSIMNLLHTVRVRYSKLK